VRPPSTRDMIPPRSDSSTNAVLTAQVGMQRLPPSNARVFAIASVFDPSATSRIHASLKGGGARRDSCHSTPAPAIRRPATSGTYVEASLTTGRLPRRAQLRPWRRLRVPVWDVPGCHVELLFDHVPPSSGLPRCGIREVESGTTSTGEMEYQTASAIIPLARHYQFWNRNESSAPIGGSSR
jgi:hypothetical protein